MKLVSGEIESFMNFTKSFVDFMDEEEALKLNEYDNQFILTEYTKYIKKILNKKPESFYHCKSLFFFCHCETC